MIDSQVKTDPNCKENYYSRMLGNLEKYYKDNDNNDHEESFIEYCNTPDVGLKPSKSYPVQNIIAGKEDFYRYYKKKGNHNLSYKVWCKVVFELMKQIWISLYSEMFVLNIRRVGRAKIAENSRKKFMWVQEDGKKMRIPALNLHTNGKAFEVSFLFYRKFFPTSIYKFRPYRGSEETMMGYKGLHAFIKNEANNGRTYESYAR